MKISIKQDVLAKAMSHAVGIIEKKQAIPVLGYVLMSANKETGLKITSTNMDMSMVEVVQSNVEEEGSVCLSASLLFDITKKMPGGSDIIIEKQIDDNSVKVTNNKTSFSLYYINSDDFPPLPEDRYDVSFKISKDVLKESINVVKVAMLQDNTRFHLNGIHMHHDNDLGINKIKFVATDLYRIACVSTVAPTGSENMPPIIISKRAITEILKLIDDSNAPDVTVEISSSRITVSLQDETSMSRFGSRLVNGTFPEYKAALEVSNDKVLIANTNEFVRAIERVRTVVMDSTNSVKLLIRKDKVEISGVSRELGSAKDEVSANFDSLEDLEICFNGKFLVELLNQIETDEVKMLLADGNSSTIIAPTVTKEEDMQFAIMPVEIVKN